MNRMEFTVPTLLLTGTMPGDSGVGDIYLKSLLDYLGNPNVALAHVSESTQKDLQPRIDGMVYRGFRSAYRRWRETPRWCGVLLEAAKEVFVQCTDEARIATEIIAFAQSRKVQFVWAVLDTPPMFRIASRVSQALNVPLITTIWDPPSGVSRLHVRNTLVRMLDRRAFEKTMAHASGAAVISKRMADEYASQFGVPVSVVRYGLAPDAVRSMHPCQPVTDEFRIAFCGSVYAEEEWAALFGALDSIRWSSQGVPVRLIVAARELPRLKLNGPANVTLLGWRSTEEVEALLRTCHAGYLPYWFAADYSESVRLCFATKLSSYLAADLPVLYHGPQDSAVADFIVRYQVGACCHTLNSANIVHSIADLQGDERRSMFTDGIRCAVQEELNADVFVSRFQELLLKASIV
jgi:hypothetical protein